jgi:UDP-N-acetylmuramate dehydrogenase
MRVGGSAEWLLEPARPEEFVEAWVAARERGFEPRVLGGGANLLIEDGHHPCVVITTDRMARVFRPGLDRPPNDEAGTEHWQSSRVDDDDPRLVVWAGAGLPGLVRAARELGWSGLQGLVGIPGHAGGAIAMNAGGRWGNMWDVVATVRLLTPDGEVIERERGDCTPSYRNGNLEDHVVLGAVLKLEASQRAKVHEEMRTYLAEKSAAQPVTERSSGCIFKNPDPELSDGRSAGQLIEACGGKGLAQGDATVSEKHGNFIVNRGKARATDVLALIETLIARVEKETQIVLEREVRFWPRGAG